MSAVALEKYLRIKILMDHGRGACQNAKLLMDSTGADKRMKTKLNKAVAELIETQKLIDKHLLKVRKEFDDWVSDFSESEMERLSKLF